MAYIEAIRINTDKRHPFPFDVPAVKFAKNVNLDAPVSFIIGDNGTGKSTLLETLAYRLQLPHMDGAGYGKKCFEAARTLVQYLEVDYKVDRPIGFLFRAEDFGDLMNSVERQDARLHAQLDALHGTVPDHIVQEMKDNANLQLFHMRKDYGQELRSFSHGEAYLHIMQEKVKQRGIYILDEPEAALSPAKQLALIHFIREHLKDHRSQFIIATHSPILMAYPGAKIHEVNADGMKETKLEDTEHFAITKSFLNDPEMFLRHLG